jgi:hypothetical protein
MNVAHLATIAAYSIKDGSGGFRGVFFVHETKVRNASERFATLEQAKYWAQAQAWKAYDGCKFAPLRRRGEYWANVWVAR